MAYTSGSNTVSATVSYVYTVGSSIAIATITKHTLIRSNGEWLPLIKRIRSNGLWVDA